MPGPVWIFGAYGIVRAAERSLDLLLLLTTGRFFVPDWLTAGFELLVLTGAFVPAGLAWLLVERKPASLSLVRWYAGLKAAAYLLALVAPLFADGPAADGPGLRFGISCAAKALVWGGFLRYLERSPTLARLLPEGNRRASRWAVAGFVVLLACGAL